MIDVQLGFERVAKIVGNWEMQLKFWDAVSFFLLKPGRNVDIAKRNTGCWADHQRAMTYVFLTSLQNSLYLAYLEILCVVQSQALVADKLMQTSAFDDVKPRSSGG